MSVETVMLRLGDILDDLAATWGHQSVFAGRPRDIPPANFPAFIVLTGEGAYSLDDSEGASSDVAVETRSYRIVLLAQPWSLGAELETEVLCRPYFVNMRTEFLDRPGLENPKGANPLLSVQTGRLRSDSGIVNIVLAGKNYAGVEWVIEVQEYVRRVYT